MSCRACALPGSGSSRPASTRWTSLRGSPAGARSRYQRRVMCNPSLKPEDAVRDGITMMMVVEEPAIKPGLTQSFLDRIELHISADSIADIFNADAGRAPAGQTLD